jgi:hypothetical protein
VILVLLVGWALAGLLLALVIGGAVRVAESRRAWEAPIATADTAERDLAATA